MRKKSPAKSNIFTLNKTENTYRLFNSDYENWQTVKLVEKSVAVGSPLLLGALLGALMYLTQHRNII